MLICVCVLAYLMHHITLRLLCLSVCAVRRSLVHWTSLGSSVSARSVPNFCNIWAVVFTVMAKFSIAYGNRLKCYSAMSSNLAHHTPAIMSNLWNFYSFTVSSFRDMVLNTTVSQYSLFGDVSTDCDSIPGFLLTLGSAGFYPHSHVGQRASSASRSANTVHCFKCPLLLSKIGSTISHCQCCCKMGNVKSCVTGEQAVQRPC